MRQLHEEIPLMTNTALRRLGNKEDAEDATGEAILAGISTFDDKKSDNLISYVWGILVCSVIPSTYRKNKRRHVEEIDEEIEDNSSVEMVEKINFIDLFSEDEQAYILLLSQTMDEPDKKNLTDKEICETLEMSRRSFLKMREEVRTKLRRFLEE